MQCCHGMAAREGKGTQPDPAQPTVARPKGKKGKGHLQDPSSGKGKGKGQEQSKGKPYASRARQDQEAEVRRSRTTGLRGRQRAPKQIRKAAAQAVGEGHQETTGEEQSGAAHLPWPPPTPPVPTKDRASRQHEDARDPPVVLRENPDAPPTPEEAYSFETDFSEEKVDDHGIPLADKGPGSPAPSSESEDKMAASSGAANHDGDTSPAEESVEESLPQMWFSLRPLRPRMQSVPSTS